jgi:hypothetical protein
MQKLINVLACVSFGVSSVVVAGGVYVYTQKDAIQENIKQRVTDGIKEAIGGSQIGSVLLGGSSDENDVTDEVPGTGTSLPVPIPVVPF